MQEYKTIFLVDDDEDDRMLMREALEKSISPITIVDVAHSHDLLRFLENAPNGPKLILMDMNMPRIDGLQMLVHLKSDKPHKHIPVVMISTTTNQAMISRAYDLGANAFIVKPVSFAEYEHVARGVGLCFLNNYRWAASTPAFESADCKTIIVVEDNDDHWYLLDAAMRNSSMRYNLVRISTKERALAFAHHELVAFLPKVDMILIDLYLPEREDGLQLLSSIRKSMQANHLENTPIVVFTYSNSAQDIDDCYRHDANAYLVKPLDITGWRFYFENLLNFWSTAIKSADTSKPFRR
ncbi:response regulator [Dyadobacter sp. CY261]|uniref:response regulator n=1 Tax=Dyadobacter sp. CY261 TaxID=2907203 RepID=UPI001F3CDD2F|nr:response regulator [Dyadobacter sp. CY261]MCF0072778.1 response regulator [Dyadobacter sp. CY261]